MTEQQKKREYNADAAREAILAAAEDQFACYGFAGARIDEIARVSGYNKSLICHHYFEGKKELYKAVLRCLKDDSIERLRQIMTPSGIDETVPLNAEEVQGFIEESIRLSFNQLLEHPRLMRILAWEAAEGWKNFNASQFKPRETQWPGEIISFIRRAQADGIIRSNIDPKMLIANVLGISLIYLLSIPRYQMLFPDTDMASSKALVHAREQIVNLLVHGILTHPKETFHAAEL